MANTRKKCASCRKRSRTCRLIFTDVHVANGKYECLTCREGPILVSADPAIPTPKTCDCLQSKILTAKLLATIKARQKAECSAMLWAFIAIVVIAYCLCKSLGWIL